MVEYARNEVMDFKPYIPGKPIDELKRELKIKGKIIKLASNENSVGVSLKVIRSIKNVVNTIYRYPDGSSYMVKKAIADVFKLKVNNIIMGSGTDELIELIAKTFFNKDDEIIVSRHAFIRYKMAGQLMGSKVIEVPMKNFTHDLVKMANCINKKTKAIFVANPNNPTGTYNTENEVKKIIKFINSSPYKPLLIFDEAYFEYACVRKDYPDTLKFHSLYSPLITLRTFSKIYGLAGLRAGYAVADEEIINYMERIRPPFNLNSLAQAGVISAIYDREHIKKSLKVVEEGKKYLYSEFEKLGLRAIPSAGNFILFEVYPLKGKDVFERLLKKGVIVRAMDEYDFKYHVRVTVGTAEENKIFIKCLKEVLKNR